MSGAIGLQYDFDDPFKAAARLHQSKYRAECLGVKKVYIRIAWAPPPATDYLDDLTSFDTYIQGFREHDEPVGLGIEVKCTERAYRIGKSEGVRCGDPDMEAGKRYLQARYLIGEYGAHPG